ncbi:hypothetical protein ACFL4Q_01440, partial [candidate division KSB1 bacterium]
MKKTTVVLCLSLLVISLTSDQVSGQDTAAALQSQSEAAKYSFHLYANTAGTSPEFIVKLDNNFHILEACI